MLNYLKSKIFKGFVLGFLGAIVFMFIIYFFAAYILFLESWEAIFGFGQFIVEVSLLPVAIVSFIITGQEFRKSLQKPSVWLEWHNLGDSFTGRVPPNGSQVFSLLPTLRNSGNAAALWYMVEIKIPAHLNPSLTMPISGDEANWREASMGDNVKLFTFMSNGQIAVFPEHPQILAEIHFRLDSKKQYAHEYVVNYSIANSWGKSINSVLKIYVLPNSQ